LRQDIEAGAENRTPLACALNPRYRKTRPSSHRSIVVRLGLVGSAVLAASFLSACATDTTPVCRAPQTHEMASFRAIISHNRTALAQSLAPGATRDALNNQDVSLNAYVWGSQGETRGTLLGLLSQPPLCVLDDPTYAATDASRHVLVYPQHAFNALSPTPESTTPMPFPYGVSMRDYMRCEFVQTATGWKLADMCGYRAPMTAYTG
jgi:hypothetical protein